MGGEREGEPDYSYYNLRLAYFNYVIIFYFLSFWFGVMPNSA